MSFLTRIRPLKLAEAAALRHRFAERPPRRPDHLPVRDFAQALRGANRLIAEVKRRSPSHPAIRQPATPAQLAAAYLRGGAAALSIVTDEANFGTSLADIADLKQAAGLPVIAKDFVVDASQVHAAWAAGADAVLLIARMLETPELNRLIDFVQSLGLTALVECHDEADLAKAAGVGATVIGVNNRDLATLTTDLARGERLLPLVPDGALCVAESGLYRRADVERLARAGAGAFLIGHALLQSPDPGATVSELAGRVAETATRVKICGLTRDEDACAAFEAGAHLLGLVFAPSPRQVSRERAVGLRAVVPLARLCGVFRDQDADDVAATATATGLDLIQLHGNESPAYCRYLLRRTGRPLIKALTAGTVDNGTVSRYDSVAYFLVDLPKADDPAKKTGEDVLAAAARIARTGGRAFVAGGLEPDTVGDLAATANIHGVDVSRGVESSPGVKDLHKLHTFMQEVSR